MAWSALNEFRLEISLLVFVLSVLGLLLVIPPFFIVSFQMPLLYPLVAPTKPFHVWIFLAASIGFLGGGFCLFISAQKRLRFRKTPNG